ncbi:hypothetical protein Apa02nite_078130 [Actinoplanes palleronii]|uniref:DUF35 domain-containing protein n=1 Tax=Actinoplanes palleronii TaxID=113570 RepID=A0ABQ4BM08_9ACTN|nr:hypothetical protein Apa02nite_078130 [Actinoplanes palleronii]
MVGGQTQPRAVIRLDVPVPPRPVGQLEHPVIIPLAGQDRQPLRAGVVVDVTVALGKDDFWYERSAALVRRRTVPGPG